MNFDLLVSSLRSHMRIPSSKGLLTIEQLFDVPLRSNNGFSLDDIARAQARVVRELEDGSYVDGPPSKQLIEAANILTVVKWVIGVLKTEEDARIRATAVKAEEQRILDALARRRDTALSNATEDELLAMLQKVRGS